MDVGICFKTNRLGVKQVLLMFTGFSNMIFGMTLRLIYNKKQDFTRRFSPVSYTDTNHE